MALQAYRLSDALAAPSPWSVLSQDFPELFSAELGLEATLGLPSSVVQARLVELYRVYTKEWRSFERATGVAEGLWVRNAQVVA